MKHIIFLFGVLFLSAVVSAEEICLSHSYSYGAARATARICYESPPSVFHDGDSITLRCGDVSQDLYLGSWEACHASGCSLKRYSHPMVYTLLPTDKNLDFTCWNKVTASNGEWAWAAKTVSFRNLVYGGNVVTLPPPPPPSPPPVGPPPAVVVPPAPPVPPSQVSPPPPPVAPEVVEGPKSVWAQFWDFIIGLFRSLFGTASFAAETSQSHGGGLG